MDYKGKVVLITGGAGGIGKATARIFLEKEAKVCICDNSEVEGKRVLKELEEEFGENNVTFAKCDVTKEEDFENAYRKCENYLGTIDILINNAGVIVKNFRTVIEVIQFGTIIGTELALKKMGKHNGGKGGFVVNMASIAGFMVHKPPLLPIYSSAKAAVIHYSRMIGSEFHHNYSGVSVLCLCPGAVDTLILNDSYSLKSDYAKYFDHGNYSSEKQEKLTPPKLKLKPNEIGDAVIKLINENKSGEVAAIQKQTGFYYVPSAPNN